MFAETIKITDVIKRNILFIFKEGIKLAEIIRKKGNFILRETIKIVETLFPFWAGWTKESKPTTSYTYEKDIRGDKGKGDSLPPNV